MTTCPECDAEIEVAPDDIEEMELGDSWDCAECASRLRVSMLDPLEFEPDDEDDEDDDEVTPKGASVDSDLDTDDDDSDDADWDD